MNDLSPEPKPASSGDSLALARGLTGAGRAEEAVALLHGSMCKTGIDASLLVALGEALTALGRHADARDMFTAAHDLSPGAPGALVGLGTACARLGDTKSALAALSEAAQRAPADPVPLIWLGDVFAGMNEAEAALACHAKAALLGPAGIDALACFGDAQARDGHWPVAARALRAALELRPGDLDLTLRTGHATLNAGDTREAVELLDRAIEIAPEDRLAKAVLAEARQREGDLVGARTLYEQVLACDPKDAIARNNLGMVLLDLGDPDSALREFREVARARPDHPGALNNIANAHRARGEFDRARGSWRAVLRRWPDNMDALLGLAADAPQDERGELEAAADAILASDLAPETRLAALHAKVRLALKGDDPGNVVALLDAAGELHPGSSEAGMAATQTAFAALATLARAGPYTPLEVTPDPALQRPIFILGMPRSGSTLSEQILASHPLVETAGEVEWLPLAIERAGISEAPPSAGQLGELRRLYFADAAAWRARRPGKPAPCLVDKMLFNFRWIGIIAAAFPEASIVHTSRSPEATCWSCFRTRFTAHGLGFSYGQRSTARYYRQYRALTELWQAGLPAGRVVGLDYEALTESPQAGARALLKGVGLDWDPAVLDFHKAGRAVRTASAGQVRKAVYKGSSQDWRRYAPHLVPMLEELAAGA